MRRFPATCVVLIAALCAVLPSPAIGNVPPGNSALDQYVEQVPVPTGDKPGKASEPRNPERSLGKAAARSLENLGPAGRSAAQLAAGSDPFSPGRDARYRHRAAGGVDLAGQAGATSSGVLAVGKHALGFSDAGGGLGILFPLIILGLTISMLVYVLLRRRRTD